MFLTLFQVWLLLLLFIGCAILVQISLLPLLLDLRPLRKLD